MSDGTPVQTINAPESASGLAMIVGELRSNLHYLTRQVHEYQRATDARMREEAAARKQADDVLLRGIEALSSTVSKIIDALADLKSHEGKSEAAPLLDTTASTHSRNRLF